MPDGFQFWPQEILPSMNNVVLFDLQTPWVCFTKSSQTICFGRSRSGVVSGSLEYLGRFSLFPLPMKAHPPSLETTTVYQLASGSLRPDLLLLLVPAPEARSISQRCTTAICHCTYGTQRLHFSM